MASYRSRLTKALADMYACPHCSSPSFSFWRKAWSTPLSPIACPTCRAESYVSGWGSLLMSLFCEAIVLLTVLLTLLTGRLIALLALPVLFAVLATVIAARYPLQPVDARMTRVRRRVRLFAFFSLIAFLAFVALKIGIGRNAV